MPNARAGLARGRSASVLHPDHDSLFKSSRDFQSRSRSPPVSRSTRTQSHHPTSLWAAASSVPVGTDKARFVDGLVSVAVTAINSVWKGPSGNVGFATGLVSSAYANGIADDGDSALDLKMFIKELLRRSRSTCSTLQVALYYIHKSRNIIRERVFHANEAKRELQRLQCTSLPLSASTALGIDVLGDDFNLGPTSSQTRAALLARERDPIAKGRRMFVAALICASKFLQDRTYSNNAWANICNLPIQEINKNEKAFLEIMQYNLFVNAEVFRNWTKKLQALINAPISHAKHNHASYRAPYGSSRRSRLSSSIPRDGAHRTHNESWPGPDYEDLALPPVPVNSRFPLTPDATPDLPNRSLQASYRLSPPVTSRAPNEPHLNATRLPSLRTSLSRHLPPPQLAAKISQVSLVRSPSQPPTTADLHLGIHGRGVRSDTLRSDLGSEASLRLPRPVLAANRFVPSNLARSPFASSTSSGSCASLARLLNGPSADDWHNDRSVVL